MPRKRSLTFRAKQRCRCCKKKGLGLGQAWKLQPTAENEDQTNQGKITHTVMYPKHPSWRAMGGPGIAKTKEHGSAGHTGLAIISNSKDQVNSSLCLKAVPLVQE